jgi:hypothetical protein
VLISVEILSICGILQRTKHLRKTLAEGCSVRPRSDHKQSLAGQGQSRSKQVKAAQKQEEKKKQIALATCSPSDII